MSETDKDGLLINKIVAGVLTAGIVLWAANRIASVVIPSEAPKTPAITIAGMQTAAVQVAAVTLPSIIPLIATADEGKGQAFVQQQCSACHTFNQGGADGIGPNLYGVMGTPVFGMPGYGFSAAAKSKAKGDWDYDNINAWLANPNSFAPGTTMSYAGIKNTQTRANVVAYLRSDSGSEIPLPTAAQVKAASAPAPAVAAAGSTPPAAPGEAAAPSIDTMFASADVSKGQALVQQQCSSCHTLNKGGAAGVGPNLYGIVGAKMFSQAGFSYSSAVKAKANGDWNADNLSAWLQDPQGFAPGTMMSYAGVKNDQTRADVIAYLNQNSASPTKLPGTK